MKNRIEEYIKTVRLSQYRLGKKIGTSIISINQIDICKTMPSLKTENDITNALGVFMFQVFDLDGEETYK